MASTTTDRRLGITGSAAIKVPCKAATTSNITLSGEQSVDGVSCVTGDRVLVKSQTSSVDNGIYVVDTGTWTRDLDFDGVADVVTGTIVMVLNGSTNSNTYWRLATTGTITFGSSAITFSAALAGDAALLTFLQSGTGATARTMQAKERDIVSVKDFAATGDGATDDTTAVQAALTFALQNNLKVTFPRGIYLVSSTLTLTAISASSYGKLVQLEGVGDAADANVGATVIKWNGSDSAANTLFKVNGVLKFLCKGIAFHGASKVGKIFYATQNVGTSFAPYGWRFEDCIFQNAKSGGSGFYIDTSTNMARFSFLGCLFRCGAGNDGFSAANPNSIDHLFLNCAFDTNDYGIHINGGSFFAVGCEFSLNVLADVYLQIHNPIVMMGCYTEQSRQFIKSDFRTQFSPLTLIGCRSASFPWYYWKIDESGRTQPTNDSSQWASVLWDGERGSLTMIGCNLIDPSNGAVTGLVPPTTASTILVNVPNGVITEPRFQFVGSFAQNGTDSHTEQFLNIGTNQLAAPRIASRKRLTSYGNLSGAFTVNTERDSTSKWIMNGNGTATLSTANTAAGNRVSIDVTQDGIGNRTLAFVNAKTAGAFVPTVTAGARSRIEFEFDGTDWIEVTRALNLA